MTSGKYFVALLACVIAIVGTSAQGATVPGLYDVVVPPSDKPGQSSFDEALRLAAVRVSGSRDAGDRLAATKPNARGPLKQFSFQPDGAAAVGFDSTAFDKLLTTANLPIWGRERPAILVWLSVPDGSGRSGWQSANERSAERDALQRVALARGIPLVWPAMDATDLAIVAAMNSSARSYSQLIASGERYRADAILLGVGTRDASGALSVRWSFAFNDEVTDTQSSVDEGMHYAADRCARILAISPGARAVVPIQVNGIHDIDAYARAINYLEGITLVVAGGVAVEQLRGEELDLRLTVRGDATALRRTIGLGRRMVEVKSTDPAMANALVFRLAP